MVALPMGRRLPVLLTVVGLVAACATGSSPSPSASMVPSQSASLPSASRTEVPSPTAAPTAAPEVGLAWNRVDDPDLVSRPRNGTTYGVIAGGPGAIAWGYVYGTGPRIWTTTNGTDWKPASVEAATDADVEEHNPGEVLDVTAGGPGYVAVGVYFRAGGDGNTSIVWTSVDGMTWQRVPADPVFARSMMSSVVSWKGELLAYGCENVSPIDCGPQRVWASSDGLRWKTIEMSLPEGTNTVSSMTSSPDRLWGRAWLYDESVPAENPKAQAMVTSTDGRTWARSTLPAITWGAVYSLPFGWYATVMPWSLPSPQFTPPPTPPGQPGPGVYRSTDMATWTLVSKGLTTVGNDLVAVGDTLIMVGDDAAGNVQCWAKCQATGWRSVDGGVTWQEVPADKVGGTMRSVVALPDGTLVAVGQTVDDKGGSSTAAWVSPPVRAFVPPPAECPSPGDAVTLPDVTVSVGGAPAVVATRWSSTTMTCTTTGTDDRPVSTPSGVVSAQAGDRFVLALPTGWVFLSVEATDRATTAEATTRPPIDTIDRPVRVDVLVPTQSGESIVGFTLWIVRDDGRVVGRLEVGIRVRIG